MDVYAQIAEKIVAGQEAIIGPVAIEQAQQVSGLTLDWPNHQVTISGNGVEVIDGLIAVYKELFGQISVEVSREAASSIAARLQGAELPSSLR